MNTEEFSNWAKQNNNFEVLSFDDTRVFLTVNDEIKLVKLIETTEKSGNVLTIHIQNNIVVYCLHDQNLEMFVNLWDNKKTKNNVMPDLEWATCKQIAAELKKRNTLTFALVYIEDDSVDNISVEANGDPNYIIGMLTRGINMLVKYTDKNKKTIEASEDEYPPED